MSAELSSIAGFAVGGSVALAATPMAISVARRTGFYDRPREYRQHAAPTPFLGGAAVLAAVLVVAATLGVNGGLLAAVGCAGALWVIGTIDDRFAVPPRWRLLAELGAAVVLFQVGLGWNTISGAPIDLVLTVVWVVGVVNAFNLMDNLDGACGTVAAVSAAGIGALAAVKSQADVAGLAFAVCAACLAFLRWNLARPSRIFLGDGGSMPIGFLVAALGMAAARHASGGNAGLLAGALVVGLPILDTSLVSYSRTRRSVTLMTGGRDHLTHRLMPVLRSQLNVALALGVAQGVLCALAVTGYELGAGALVGVAFLAFVLGLGAIYLLDTPRWRPAEIAVGVQFDGPPGATEPAEASVGVDSA